eukprot:6123623-Amphidinium_carterae.1
MPPGFDLEFSRLHRDAGFDSFQSRLRAHNERTDALAGQAIVSGLVRATYARRICNLGANFSAMAGGCFPERGWLSYSVSLSSPYLGVASPSSP